MVIMLSNSNLNDTTSGQQAITC